MSFWSVGYHTVYTRSNRRFLDILEPGLPYGVYTIKSLLSCHFGGRLPYDVHPIKSSLSCYFGAWATIRCIHDQIIAFLSFWSLGFHTVYTRSNQCFLVILEPRLPYGVNTMKSSLSCQFGAFATIRCTDDQIVAFLSFWSQGYHTM